MEITPLKLEQLLITAAELGAKQAIDKLGLHKKQISRAEAYKRHSKHWVDTWRREGLVDCVKRGKTTYYDFEQLEKQATINRLMERLYDEE